MRAVSVRTVARQSGAMMIEIIIAIVIVVIGLWGVLDLQSRLHVSEMESYQRTQALILLDDMASRIASNRANPSLYVTDPVDGVGVDTANCGSTSAGSLDARDEAEWCLALKGAAEKAGVNNVGTLVGGRGCVEYIGTGGVEEYLVTVAWQGFTPLAQPQANVTCGQDKYNLRAGSEFASSLDFCRRYVSTIVRMADLTDL